MQIMRSFLRKLLCAILLALALLNDPLFAIDHPIPQPNAKIYRSENLVTLDTPILLYNRLYYVPIKDLAESFGFETAFLRRADGVLVKEKDPAHVLEIDAHTAEYTRDGLQRFFPDKTLVYQTRLYVPLEAFLKAIGYTVERQGADFYALDTREVANATVATENIAAELPAPKEIFLIEAKTKYQFLPLPPFSKLESGNLVFEDYKISMKKIAVEIDGTLYAELAPLLIHKGYSAQVGRSHLQLEKNHTRYIFRSGESSVTVIRNRAELFRKIPYKPILWRNRFMFPVVAFAQDLGYVVAWNSETQELVFKKRLDSFQLSEAAGGYTFTVNTPQDIFLPKPNFLSNPSRIFWDIPGTEIPFDQMTQAIDHPTFRRFSLGRHETFTRVVIETSQAVTQKQSDANEAFLKIVPSSSKLPDNPAASSPPATSTTQTPPTSTATSSTQVPSPKRAQDNQSDLLENTAVAHLLEGKTILIDPGHGGSDPGAISPTGEQEKHYTLDISKHLKTLLESNGAKVVMTRTVDTNPSLDDRANLATRSKANVQLSVHINSFIKPYANGIETYYFKVSDRPIAVAIHRELVRELGLHDNGIKRGRMYVLNHSPVPGALIEPCFITNPQERELLMQESFRIRIAQSIHLGVLRYFSRKR